MSQKSAGEWARAARPSRCHSRLLLVNRAAGHMFRSQLLLSKALVSLQLKNILQFLQSKIQERAAVAEVD